jgi:hypothetical protein
MEKLTLCIKEKDERAVVDIFFKKTLEIQTTNTQEWKNKATMRGVILFALFRAKSQLSSSYSVI